MYHFDMMQGAGNYQLYCYERDKHEFFISSFLTLAKTNLLLCE